MSNVCDMQVLRELRYNLKKSCFRKEGDSLDCYISEGPRFMNFFDLFTTDLEKRAFFLSWDSGVSDIEGCINMHSPKPIQCNLALGSPSVPVLCLLDELEQQDFVASSKLVVHTKSSGKFFDDRDAAAKRNYFQCVLAKKEIFSKGSTLLVIPTRLLSRIRIFEKRVNTILNILSIHGCI